MTSEITSETVGDIRRTDPIRFQVLYNAFSSIVDEMGALLQKVAFSLVVSEGRDYSGTICTRTGDLVASGSTDLPAHLGTIPFTVKGTLDWIKRPPEEFFQPGDVVLVNDPYIGGTHHNDVRAIMPVYLDSRLAAFVQCSAHRTDIGGHVPGTFDPNARSSHGEALAITPVHDVRRGVFDKEVADLVLRNVRMGEVAFGDLLAQIGAVRLGERRLSELADRYGSETVTAAMDQVIGYSEDVLRGEFLKLPDGEWDVEALIDRDPGADDDAPLAVRMTLRIDGDRVVMDFSRSSGLAKGAMNASRAVSISSAVVTLKMIFPGAPMNQGVFRAVDFVVPDGLLVSAPFPYPTSGMAAGVYPAVADCVLKAFIRIVPERCMAGPTGLLNIVIGGYDPRPGYERDFVTYLWLEGGWGGRAARKDNHTAMTTFATTATNQPIELQERLFPVRYECYRLEQDSAGAGTSRGGLGVRRRWVLTHGPGVLSDLGDGERFGPWGFAGGHDAAPNRFLYSPGTDKELNIGMFRTGLHVEPGEVLDCFQPGGGGYGDPFTRDTAAVVEDVVDGYVSVAGARRDYGVVVREADGGRGSERYVLDEDGTRRARAGAGAEAP
jgi:N-methylhydantoinase B